MVMATYGPPDRGPIACSARATSSLPAPVSPRTRNSPRAPAASRTAARTAWTTALYPNRPRSSAPRGSWSVVSHRRIRFASTHGDVTDRQVDTGVGNLDPFAAEPAHRERHPDDEPVVERPGDAAVVAGPRGREPRDLRDLDDTTRHQQRLTDPVERRPDDVPTATSARVGGSHGRERAARAPSPETVVGWPPSGKHAAAMAKYEPVQRRYSIGVYRDRSISH